jgi:hypothetical protein
MQFIIVCKLYFCLAKSFLRDHFFFTTRYAEIISSKMWETLAWWFRTNIWTAVVSPLVTM